MDTDQVQSTGLCQLLSDCDRFLLAVAGNGSLHHSAGPKQHGVPSA